MTKIKHYECQHCKFVPMFKTDKCGKCKQKADWKELDNKRDMTIMFKGIDFTRSNHGRLN
jgi:hypothetical protein